jgi:hypothetical protein
VLLTKIVLCEKELVMPQKTYRQVYQFRIALIGILPYVWRRIQVPETYTFWDLHVAIQDAMGWKDCRLHMFYIPEPSTGKLIRMCLPSKELYHSATTKVEYQEKIANWFTLENNQATYIYDPGNGWRHEIKLEKILPRATGIKYPVCTHGMRGCPPEDSGGPHQYMTLLEAINNPFHQRHDEFINKVDKDFDPEYFDPRKIVFSNPAKRLKTALKYL